jgi:hypothetical protein
MGRTVRTIGYTAISVFGLSMFFFGFCAEGEIGEGGKVRLIRALASPVIIALDEYRRVNGKYPTSLNDLAPRYLTPGTLQAPKTSVLARPFEYRADSTSYELSVSYIGPGANTCSYRPHSKWECGGFY